MFEKAEDGQKRSDDRMDVLWDARATIDGEQYDCEVANVSTAGALMKLDIELAQSQQFILDVKDLKEYAAQVMWVNRPFYGLKLLVGEDLKLKDHVDKVGLKNKD